MKKKLISKAIQNQSQSQDLSTKYITSESKEYRSDQLNWRDDGNALEDPSMNDFLLGYNINPYEFQQWAKLKHKKQFKTAMKKVASGEVFVMQFSPEFLADRILTLWNGVDGPLQNFFEAFTLRYNNTLKKQVAVCLAKQGYQVFPQLVDDKPRYAKRLEKLMTKVAATKDIDTILHFATSISHSDNLRLFAGELTDLRDFGHPVTMPEAKGILQYYQQCYPTDYALKLVSGLMNSTTRQSVDFTKFNDTDWDFSDASLKQIENYMSSNAPSYVRDGGVNGWNFTTDMRDFDGTAPGRYEVSAMKRLNKKVYKRADKRNIKKK